MMRKLFLTFSFLFSAALVLPAKPLPQDSRVLSGTLPNGTEHFPPGKLIPYFESIGMQFGADLNAYTSFDQTVYMLYTPDPTTNQIDKALMVLSDYAFRDSFVPEEVEKERGVVLEEAR